MEDSGRMKVPGGAGFCLLAYKTPEVRKTGALPAIFRVWSKKTGKGRLLLPPPWPSGPSHHKIGRQVSF
ncbi:MAG: hypothetical protein D4R73_05010 [Deltaproteobacteria bacterium]|nr:MAG: hypothetical protein D4R73_05010 [Deltaproteobacteria bacterium]